MADVHQNLDAILALLVGQGFDAATTLASGPAEAEVRAAFSAAGVDPPKELVDLFTWREVISPRGFAALFREALLHPLDVAIATYKQIHDVANSDPLPVADPRVLWPGPATWFPALMVDGSEFVGVECGEEDRGSVWFVFTQDQPHRMYASLGEAIAAARRCLEEGLWHFDSKQGMVEGDGHNARWLADPQLAPWRVTA